MEKMDPLLSLEKHCFYVGTQSHETSLPAALPFHLGIHPRYAIPRLLMNPAISSALDLAYSLGSMASTPLGESPLASIRMNEMIDGLTKTLGKSIENCNLLEIGAGSGGLMVALKDKGASVTGVEIGPQGRIAAKKHGLKIVDAPFTSNLFNERFDVIYSYGCLEHLSDLDTFFAACRVSLKEGGLMFHSVPNSEYYFETGSLDHLAHEHLNYFSKENGVRLFEAQGFMSAGAKFTRAGNEMMLWGILNSSHQPHWPVDAVAFEKERLDGYAKLLYERMDRVQHNLTTLFASGESVGFYAGGYEYGVRMREHKPRYFDGDAYVHGKTWLAGLPPIEPPEAMLDNPVDHLVIFKPHYFNDIVSALQAMNITKPHFWNVDLFSKKLVTEY